MINVDDLSSLGPALKELRGHVRMTQGEVCASAGLKPSQLSRWENGHEKPTLESVVKVLAALDRDLSDLQAVLSGDDPEEVLDGDRGVRQRRQRHERVRAAYGEAWSARLEVAACMADGLIPLEDEAYAAERRERVALLKLLGVASGQFVDPQEGYFARLSIRELWGHFRVLEPRFPPWVTEGLGEAPAAHVLQFAEEHWGPEEVRRYLTSSEPRDVTLAAQVERLADQLEDVEERLERLEAEQ
ncbi:MAG: helix-turn-helix transcriptional regulator [Acidobacteriota bacterium]